VTDMNQLLELARQLGRETARHERTSRLRQAQQDVEADPEAKQLIEAYQQQANRVRQLEAQQQPVEPEDKQKLAQIEEQISTNGPLSELTRRQVDFVEMMQKIKRTIDEELQKNA